MGGVPPVPKAFHSLKSFRILVPLSSSYRNYARDATSRSCDRAIPRLTIRDPEQRLPLEPRLWAAHCTWLRSSGMRLPLLVIYSCQPQARSRCSARTSHPIGILGAADWRIWLIGWLGSYLNEAGGETPSGSLSFKSGRP